MHLRISLVLYGLTLSMGKRRTKKDKQFAKHSFSVQWESGTSKLKFEPSVNSQFKKPTNSPVTEPKSGKTTVNTDQYQQLGSIKKNIYTTLTISSLILASEVVLYLVWR